MKTQKPKFLILLICFLAFSFNVKAQTYDPYAVQVINNLIANNGLQAAPNAPETWEYITWWNDSTPKQLLALNLGNKDLTGTVVLSELTNMIGVNIYYNSLTKLNVSGCSQLQSLMCWYSNITELDLTGCVALTNLQCPNNNLTRLDVSTCVNLQFLICANNKLTELDLTNTTKLTNVAINNNNFIKFEAPNCIKLEVLTVDNNKLTELDVTKNKQLRVLTGKNNRLTELILTGVKPYGTFECYDQNVSLTLNESEAGEYIHSILLNFPTFGNSAISYSESILKSSDTTVRQTNFTVEAIGSNDFQLSGVMNFNYSILEIKMPKNIHLKIYPNPTTGELRIENGELEIKNVEVFDIYGRKQRVESREQNGERETIINISHLPLGIYLLYIDTKQGEIIKKVVKH